MEIKLLTEETISRIAAGEVIERPLNVVKELVENSIDAGSTAITVEIKDGGISLVRVTDNGCGIEKDQIAKAFVRHATSKIRDAEDLSRLSSLGFRGEALASIASVAQVEMITKVRGAISGTRAMNDHLASYSPDSPVKIDLEEIGAPDGTTVFVRNLFGSIPVRRKFLRQPQTEAGYITDLIEKQALSHPRISFHYRVNGQDKLHTTGNGSLKELIYRIYGRETAGAILPIHAEDPESGMVLDGFLGKPEVSRSSRSFETFFINGRMLRSKELSAGLEEGYRTDLMQHRFPFAVLHLTMRPEDVDVNVHPSKMEVRFTDRRAVFRFLNESVHAVLHKTELIPKANLNTAKEERALARKESRLREQRLQEARLPEAFESGRTSNVPVPPSVSYSAESTPLKKTAPTAENTRKGSENRTSGPGTAANEPGAASSAYYNFGPSADSSGSAEHNFGAAENATGSAEHNVKSAADSSGSPCDSGFLFEDRRSYGNASGASGSSFPSSLIHKTVSDEPSQETGAGDGQPQNGLLQTGQPQRGSSDGIIPRGTRTELAHPQTDASFSGESHKAPFADFRQESPAYGPAQGTNAETADQESIAAVSEKNGQLTLEGLLSESVTGKEDDRLLTKQKAEKFKYIGQIFGTYWIIEYEKKLLIIDQHAAHEKVNYERMMRRIEKEHPGLDSIADAKDASPEDYLNLDRLTGGAGGSGSGDSESGSENTDAVFVASQQLLPPIVIRLSGKEESAYLQYRNVFAAMGYEIEEFGGGAYAIRAVPTELFGQSADSLLREILEEIMNERISGTPHTIIAKVASMSCKAAVKGNNRLSETEARALIAELLELDNPYHCPHGRPTMVVMSQYEIDRKFKRIV